MPEGRTGAKLSDRLQVKSMKGPWEHRCLEKVVNHLGVSWVHAELRLLRRDGEASQHELVRSVMEFWAMSS